ncbi:MAG TPA: response regulator [Methanospirillum sp.]|nr:response regulator [Methanospirillum sp.]
MVPIRQILVIDDAHLSREILKMFLIKGGYSVVEAEDGLQGIDQFVKYNPDMVIADLNMPRMNGIQTLLAIKGISPQAKVMICSACSDQRMIQTAFKCGACGYIVKPFQGGLVIEAVKNHLEGIDDSNTIIS